MKTGLLSSLLFLLQLNLAVALPTGSPEWSALPPLAEALEPLPPFPEQQATPTLVSSSGNVNRAPSHPPLLPRPVPRPRLSPAEPSVAQQAMLGGYRYPEQLAPLLPTPGSYFPVLAPQFAPSISMATSPDSFSQVLGPSSSSSGASSLRRPSLFPNLAPNLAPSSSASSSTAGRDAFRALDFVTLLEPPFRPRSERAKQMLQEFHRKAFPLLRYLPTAQIVTIENLESIENQLILSRTISRQMYENQNFRKFFHFGTPVDRSVPGAIVMMPLRKFGALENPKLWEVSNTEQAWAFLRIHPPQVSTSPTLLAVVKSTNVVPEDIVDLLPRHPSTFRYPDILASLHSAYQAAQIRSAMNLV